MLEANYFIEKAYKLALKAKGKTHPNPLVGAVVVKNNKIIGFGYHKKAGLPHAEISALRKAGVLAKGADLYVTLEPCCHYGKTPPCTDTIIKSGIKKVFIGMIDPNPLNRGKGIKILKKHKIITQVGFLEEKLKKMNEVFIKYITKNLPFVTVKVGQSLDGKIATKNYQSKWITSSLSRKYAHKLRDSYDAIMIGVNTIIKDKPLLNSKRAIKIIVDSNLKTPLNSRIFSNKSPNPVIIATTNKNFKKFKNKAEILLVKEKNRQVNLKDLMKKLAKKEISNILVEGGGTLIGSLFDEKLVDKILFFIAPKIIGGKNSISSIQGEGINNLKEAPILKNINFKRIGSDILIEGNLNK